jgi:flagellar hook-associated protein 2
MGELKASLDPANGGLAQDPATRAARSQLLQLTSATVMPNATSGDPKTLSDLGMSIDKSGNFTLDTARLTKVLGDNPKGVAAMFTTGLYGIYGTIDGLTRNLTATGQAGSLGSAIDKYTKLKSTLADQRGQLVTQQDQVRTRLIKQFASTNSLVATSKSTLSYLQNQIAAWNKP